MVAPAYVTFVANCFSEIFCLMRGVKIKGKRTRFPLFFEFFQLQSQFWPTRSDSRVSEPPHSSWEIMWRFWRSRKIENRLKLWDFMVRNVTRVAKKSMKKCVFGQFLVVLCVLWGQPIINFWFGFAFGILLGVTFNTLQVWQVEESTIKATQLVTIYAWTVFVC